MFWSYVTNSSYLWAVTLLVHPGRLCRSHKAKSLIFSINHLPICLTLTGLSRPYHQDWVCHQGYKLSPAEEKGKIYPDVFGNRSRPGIPRVQKIPNPTCISFSLSYNLIPRVKIFHGLYWSKYPKNLGMPPFASQPVGYHVQSILQPYRNKLCLPCSCKSLSSWLFKQSEQHTLKLEAFQELATLSPQQRMRPQRKKRTVSSEI